MGTGVNSVILYRYLCRELLLALLAITAILLAIFLCDQFVMLISKSVLGKFPSEIVWRLLVIQVPYFLVVLLPLGLYLAILLVFGRRYVDNEMTVLSTCGVSMAQQTKMVMSVALVVSAVVAVNSFWLIPKLLDYQKKITSTSSATLILKTVLPGRFKATQDGKHVFYVESLSRDRKHMKNVFIAEVEHPNDPKARTWHVLSGRKGDIHLEKHTGDSFVVVNDGYRYEGTPGHNNFRIAKFSEYGQRVPNKALNIHPKPERTSTRHLWHQAKEHNRYAIAELQWRFAMPLGVLVLALLAIPLSRINPRQGRYAQLIPAILIYVAFSNFLIVGRRWLEKELLTPTLGLWWLHVGVLMIAVSLWLAQGGWRRIRRRLGPNQALQRSTP